MVFRFISLYAINNMQAFFIFKLFFNRASCHISNFTDFFLKFYACMKKIRGSTILGIITSFIINRVNIIFCNPAVKRKNSLSNSIIIGITNICQEENAKKSARVGGFFIGRCVSRCFWWRGCRRRRRRQGARHRFGWARMPWRSESFS